MAMTMRTKKEEDVQQEMGVSGRLSGNFKWKLLCLIEMRVLVRQGPLTFKRHRGTNYLYHSPLPRMMRVGNDVYSELDFFGDTSVLAFKRRVGNLLLSRVDGDI
ncbi:hypothetical protein J6590_006682 [Homalodisca vitripennis]|nr:hypothetical protein J6590_006682 [Homalodisca vitripennis]